jgi:hypothetical protein
MRLTTNVLAVAVQACIGLLLSLPLLAQPALQGQDSTRAFGDYWLAYRKGKAGIWHEGSAQWVVPQKCQRIEVDGQLAACHFSSGKTSYVAAAPIGGQHVVFEQAVRLGSSDFYKVGQKKLWGLLQALRQPKLPLAVAYERLWPADQAGDDPYALLQAQKADQTGLWHTRQGRWLVPCQYHEVAPSNHADFFRVRLGEKWGLYEGPAGRAVLEPTWDDANVAGQFQNGLLYKVKQGDYWGLHNGRTPIVPTTYDDFDFSLVAQNLLVLRKGTRFGLMSLENFRELLPPTLQEVTAFDQENLLVKKQGKFGLLNLATKQFQLFPDLSVDFEAAWGVSSEVLPPTASIRVADGRVWLPMPLRKRIVCYQANNGREASLLEPGKLNRAGEFALHDGRAFFSDGMKRLFAFRADGAKAWEYEAADTIAFAPVIGRFGAQSGAQAAIALANGTVLGLDCATGRVAWQLRLDTLLLQPPVAADTDGDGTDELLLAIGASDEACTGPAWALAAYQPHAGAQEPSWRQEMGCGEASPLITLPGGAVLGISGWALHAAQAGQSLQSHPLGQEPKQFGGLFAFHPDTRMVYALEAVPSGTGYPFITCATAIFDRVGDEVHAEGDAGQQPDAMQSFAYHIGKVKAQPLVADLLGTGSPQAVFLSEEGLMLLLNAQGGLAKAYNLPSGSKTTPWAGDADGDGHIDLIVTDDMGRTTLYKGKAAGRVVWGEKQGSGQNDGRIR